jgi:hypothetical protein
MMDDGSSSGRAAESLWGSPVAECIKEFVDYQIESFGMIFGSGIVDSRFELGK